MRVEIENQIYSLISNIINQYLAGKTLNTKHVKNIITKIDYDTYINNIKGRSIFNAKKDFNKNSSINQLIKDINYTGENEFKNKNDYKNFIRKVLNNIINDKIAVEKDFKKNESRLYNYRMFEEYKLTPHKNYDERLLAYFNKLTSKKLYFYDIFEFIVEKHNKKEFNNILNILKNDNLFDKTDDNKFSKKDFSLIYDLILYKFKIFDINYLKIKYDNKKFIDNSIINFKNNKISLIIIGENIINNYKYILFNLSYYDYIKIIHHYDNVDELAIDVSYVLNNYFNSFINYFKINNNINYVFNENDEYYYNENKILKPFNIILKALKYNYK